MKRYLYVLALLPVVLWSTPCMAQDQDATAIYKTLFKCWRAVSHEYSTIYGLEEDEIKTYSKQKVCFAKDSAVMYHGTLLNTQYSYKKVNAENYAKANFDCGKDKLGIVKDSLYQITILSETKPDTNDVVHKMTDIIAFDGEFVFVVKDGVIFKLYDANAKINGRSSN